MNLKEYKFSGFSEQTIFDPDRLMKKDGTSNVRKIGIKRKFQRDLYHYLIHTSWGGFFIVILLVFSVLNAIFATLFFSLPLGQFSGML
ncbi:MAG: inward rectifier potassium channel, partial [Luteibaculaceae bacterium]